MVLSTATTTAIQFTVHRHKEKVEISQENKLKWNKIFLNALIFNHSEYSAINELFLLKSNDFLIMLISMNPKKF